MNIIITGASRGIGFYTALQLAKNTDHKIFALSRDETGLKKLSELIKSDQLITMPFDITNDKMITESIGKISGMVSGVEVLINNAGHLIKKSFVELTHKDWQDIYNVNVFGVVDFTKALLPLLLKGKISPLTKTRAHILNISSMGGIQGSIKFNGLSGYSSSKGALITISECLSEELKLNGIHVNVLALGSVETEMFQRAFPGTRASINVTDMATWIGDFALNGHRFFNGKVIPLSTYTP